MQNLKSYLCLNCPYLRDDPREEIPFDEHYLKCDSCRLSEFDYYCDVNRVLFLLVVGSRTFNNADYFDLKIDSLMHLGYQQVIIVSDGADGADYLAKSYAINHNRPYVEFNAQWNEFGKSAGYIRNDEMHKYISTFPNRMCVAFWDGKSKGTQHNFELAKKYNNPISIIRTDRVGIDWYMKKE